MASQIPRSFALTIKGQARSCSKVFDVLNPFDGKAFAQAPDGSASDVDDAVAGAREALPAWSAAPWGERAAAVNKCSKKLFENKDSLAALLTMEQGKGLPQSMEEVLGSCKWMGMAAAEPNPNHVVKETDKVLVEQQYNALGVVAAIIPWNFPAILIHFKIAQALMAGCCVVLKPSEHTPLTALRIVELYNEVLPAGVLSVVSSSDPGLGRVLVEHPGVDKISFTGSTETGKKIMAGAAATLRRATMELGGNDAAIVLGDCDPSKVARAMYGKIFGNSGQICLAVKRVLVHESIFDEYCAALGALAKAMPAGNGMEKGVVFGPVNNEMQYTKVRELLVDAVERGATIVQGAVPPPAEKGKGYLFQPTVLKGVDTSFRVWKEEQFGPIIAPIAFSDVDAAIALANDSEYGLGASVWTADVKEGQRVAEQLVAGTSWVNDHGNIVDSVPFGGAKDSGLGVEGGKEGLLAFMQMTLVKVNKSPVKFAKL